MEGAKNLDAAGQRSVASERISVGQLEPSSAVLITPLNHVVSLVMVTLAR